MTAPAAPTFVRTLSTPAASALADLAATFEELQTVLGCCERLVSALAAPAQDEVLIESLWTTTLLSYSRCFQPGPRGMGLTAEDVTGTKLEGAVEDWHALLLRMREHFADSAVDPRERFAVGVSRNSEGTAAGIAVTSVRQPLVDEVTVRQTGALAYALLRVVDERIGTQQQLVFDASSSMTALELDRLPEVELA